MLTLYKSDLEQIRDLLVLLRVFLESSIKANQPPDTAEDRHNLKADRGDHAKATKWLAQIDANIGQAEKAALRKPLPRRGHPSRGRPPVRPMPRNIPRP